MRDMLDAYYQGGFVIVNERGLEKFFNLINQPVQPSIAVFSTLFRKSKVRTDLVKKEHLHKIPLERV